MFTAAWHDSKSSNSSSTSRVHEIMSKAILCEGRLLLSLSFHDNSIRGRFLWIKLKKKQFWMSILDVYIMQVHGKSARMICYVFESVSMKIIRALQSSNKNFVNNNSCYFNYLEEIWLSNNNDRFGSSPNIYVAMLTYRLPTTDTHTLCCVVCTHRGNRYDIPTSLSPCSFNRSLPLGTFSRCRSIQLSNFVKYFAVTRDNNIIEQDCSKSCRFFFRWKLFN